MVIEKLGKLERWIFGSAWDGDVELPGAMPMCPYAHMPIEMTANVIDMYS